MTDPKKILIRCPNWLGDIIMCLPIFEALKQQFPHAQLHALIKTPFHEILNIDTRIDKVIAFEKPKSLIQKLNCFSLAKKLKKENYDVSICLTRSLSSALPLFIAGIKQRIGSSMFLGSILITDTICLNKQLHQRKQYLSFLKPLGILTAAELACLDKTNYSSPLKDSLDKPYILFHPGASYGSAKTWPLDYFEKLASYFLEIKKYKVIFLGDKTQNKPSLCHEDLIDLTGKTSLNDLAALISNAELVVCNDSGPMHICDAVGTKLIAIFGPTDPALTGPKNTFSHVVFNKTPCGPCFERKCPLDHKCMRQIHPEMIFQKALHLLEVHGSS